ncbi:MAG: hypothetical protein Homavirus38_4 [Homavirus sp.]|uniref:Uncharacterized protein n=1 Tax=Homavirus sp. TaxID=2487769 RepID=A0A3G5A545_9VIRU|nr:MAG: hypothetical protein Homavirus38_4 [Homavirus sp.]
MASTSVVSVESVESIKSVESVESTTTPTNLREFYKILENYVEDAQDDTDESSGDELDDMDEAKLKKLESKMPFMWVLMYRINKKVSDTSPFQKHIAETLYTFFLSVKDDTSVSQTFINNLHKLLDDIYCVTVRQDVIVQCSVLRGNVKWHTAKPINTVTFNTQHEYFYEVLRYYEFYSAKICKLNETQFFMLRSEMYDIFKGRIDELSPRGTGFYVENLKLKVVRFTKRPFSTVDGDDDILIFGDMRLTCQEDTQSANITVARFLEIMLKHRLYSC